MNDESASAEPRSPREIEHDIEHLRTRLDRSLAELDRRRHELTNVKLQMRKHPAVFIGAGAVVLLLLGGVGFAIYRSHKREEIPQKAKHSDVTAIVISEYLVPELLQRAMANGAFACLRKPVFPPELAQVVAEARGRAGLRSAAA